MSERFARREALRRLALFTAAAATPAWLAGCSKKPNCTDVSGLTPDDLTMRNTTAAYVDQAPDPSKKCSGCIQYVPAAPNACGSCKVVKGPINPDGWCKLYAPKPA